MALNDFRAVCLPYCIFNNDDGTYTILNREYKPLGFCTNNEDWKEKDLPIRLKMKIHPKKLEKILSIGNGASKNDAGHIFLYSDGSNPVKGGIRAKEYFQRLEVLLDIEVNNLR